MMLVMMMMMMILLYVPLEWVSVEHDVHIAADIRADTSMMFYVPPQSVSVEHNVYYEAGLRTSEQIYAEYMFRIESVRLYAWMCACIWNSRASVQSRHLKWWVMLCVSLQWLSVARWFFVSTRMDTYMLLWLVCIAVWLYVWVYMHVACVLM